MIIRCSRILEHLAVLSPYSMQNISPIFVLTQMNYGINTHVNIDFPPLFASRLQAYFDANIHQMHWIDFSHKFKLSAKACDIHSMFELFAGE